MKKLFKLIIVSLLVLCLGQISFAGPLEENRTANFSFSFEVPNDFQIAPTSVSLKDLIPSQVYKGKLIIQNDDDVNAEYEIQVHDGIIDKNGQFVFSRIFEDKEGKINSWVQFKQTKNILVKGLEKKVEIPFFIKIPVGSTPGDYISKITVVLKNFSVEGKNQVEEDSKSGDTKVSVSTGKGGSMTFNVSGDAFYKLLINSVNWNTKTNKTYLKVGLKNESNISVRPITFVNIKNGNGDTIYNNKFINQQPVFPAAEINPDLELENLKELPYGKYEVETDLYYLSEYDFTKLASDIKDDKITKESLIMAGKATFYTWILPFTAIYISIGVIGFLIVSYLIWYYFKRIRKKAL